MCSSDVSPLFHPRIYQTRVKVKSFLALNPTVGDGAMAFKPMIQEGVSFMIDWPQCEDGDKSSKLLLFLLESRSTRADIILVAFFLEGQFLSGLGPPLCFFWFLGFCGFFGILIFCGILILVCFVAYFSLVLGFFGCFFLTQSCSYCANKAKS